LQNEPEAVVRQHIRKLAPGLVVTSAATKFAAVPQESGFTEAKEPSADPAILKDVAYFRYRYGFVISGV
jgi:hypothetical protein